MSDEKQKLLALMRSTDLKPEDEAIPCLAIMCIGLAYKNIARIIKGREPAYIFLLVIKQRGDFKEIIFNSVSNLLKENIINANVSLTHLSSPRIQIVLCIRSYFVKEQVSALFQLGESLGGPSYAKSYSNDDLDFYEVIPNSFHYTAMDLSFTRGHEEPKCFVIDSMEYIIPRRLLRYLRREFKMHRRNMYFCCNQTQDDSKNCSIFAWDHASQLSYTYPYSLPFHQESPPDGIKIIAPGSLDARLLRNIQSCSNFKNYYAYESISDQHANLRGTSFSNVVATLKKQWKIEKTGEKIFVNVHIKKKREELRKKILSFIYQLDDRQIIRIVEEITTGKKFFNGNKMFEPDIIKAWERAFPQ